MGLEPRTGKGNRECISRVHRACRPHPSFCRVEELIVQIWESCGVLKSNWERGQSGLAAKRTKTSELRVKS